MFLYLPLTKKKASLVFTRKSIRRSHKVILDLEDSAMDINSLSTTRELKKQARDGMEFLCEKLSFSELKNIYIRINDPKSPYFFDDIYSLSCAVKNGNAPFGIFLPKLESEKEIMTLVHALNDNDLGDLKIVVMLETEKGFDFIAQVSNQISAHIYGIHYGQFDYNLDQSYWPFESYSSGIYWMNTGRILSTIIKNKIQLFVQTPYTYLNPDFDSLYESYNSLKNLAKGRFDFELSVLSYDCLIDDNELNLEKDKKVKKNIAIDIVRQFKQAQASSRSFASIAGKFVPPHEYLAAKNYIDTLNE